MSQKATCPPEKPMRLYNFRLDDELVDSVDQWRQAQPDTPSRTEAFRRLTRQGIKSQEVRP